MTLSLEKQYQLYKEYLTRQDVFYNHIILTAADEEQAADYRSQIETLRSQKRIPTHEGTAYTVVHDARPAMGCGGATLHVLDLVRPKPTDRILLIHAGGYSKRLPQCSRKGKIFARIPIGSGTDVVTMLELKIALFVNEYTFPQGPGLWLTCSDDLIEVDTTVVRMSEGACKGFACLAHKSTLHIGTMHGVFVFEREGSHQCSKFLHKPSIELMKDHGACVKGGDHVYTDSSYFMSSPVLQDLLELYEKHSKSFTGELDAYTDFLTPLGTSPLPPKPTLDPLRLDIFHTLRRHPLIAFPSDYGFFAHLGTLEEYIDHLTTATGEVAVSLGLGPSRCEVCLLDTVETLTSPVRKIVLDNCHGLQNARFAGENIVCVDVHFPSSCILTVPANTFVYTVTLSTKRYTTVVMDIHADPKALWTDNRFIVCETPEESVRAALSTDAGPIAEGKEKVSLQYCCGKRQ